MKCLVIEFLKEEKPLAIVYPNLDGTFRVESTDREAKDYFSHLINQISKENPKLPLMTGQTEIKDDKIVHKTTQKQIPNTSVEYLDALWDYFNKGKPEYKGRRFRAYTYNSQVGKRDREVITGSVEETIRKRRAFQHALGEMQKLKNTGLFESGVDVEAILKTAVPSRIQYFEQAAREHQVRRAVWVLMTGVDPRTLGKNFHEMPYPPLQMNQFYRDVKEYFSPLILQLGLKFELANPQYHSDGVFEMSLKGGQTETKYSERDPVAAYTWMVGFINTHQNMPNGTYLINLAPFSGRGFLVLVRNIDGEKRQTLERMLVMDRDFSSGSWSRVFSIAQGMDDVDWNYGLIEVSDSSIANHQNGVFFNHAKRSLDLVHKNNKLSKMLEELIAGYETEQMPKDYFRQYVVNKLNELDPTLEAKYVQ